MNIALIATFFMCACASAWRRNTKFGKKGTAKELALADGERVCITAECTKIAGSVLEYMDAAVDPCEDFYSFACGNFIRHQQIPQDETHIGVLMQLTKKLTLLMSTIVGQAVQSEEPSSSRKAKRYYQSCMNHEKLENTRSLHFMDHISRLGGWSAIKEVREEESFSLTSLLDKIQDEGFSTNIFWKLMTGVDLKHPEKRIIQIDQPNLGLHHRYLAQGSENRFVKAYEQMMVDMAVLMGADQLPAESSMEKVLKFEIELSKILIPEEQRRDLSQLYKKMQISELHNKMPSIPWLEIINRHLEGFHTVTEAELILVFSIPYLMKLEHLLQKTENSLPAAMGMLYVKGHFDEKKKAEAVEMINNIHYEFDQVLDKADWLDEKTRELAKEKSEKMMKFVAYPDELVDFKIVNHFYENLTVYEDTYLQNIMAVQKFYTRRELEKFREKVDRNDWIYHAGVAIVNAYYNFFVNAIDIPAGILQGMFFRPYGPKYMNYGSIGYVIGHEITHGFDDIGKQFSAHGALQNWWKKSTEDNFKKKSKCIVEQYGNYSVPSANLTVNGINTQGENIADNAGVNIAYRAYEKWTKENGEEPRLPGLASRTPKQMFWISMAQTFCIKRTPESMLGQVLVDVHAPENVRVIGSLSNSPDFAKDFQCSATSAMNPQRKCAVW